MGAGSLLAPLWSAMNSRSVVPTLVRNTATALGAYGLVGRGVSLLGWVANIPRLTDWFTTGISIQPNTALTAALAGAAIVHCPRDTGARRPDWVSWSR